jgi:carotenoid cleavage dioxygenase-like enzyme
MTNSFYFTQPYTASVTAIPMTLMKGYSVKDWFEWKPHLRNRFHIIDKESGRVIKTEYASAEPFFFLHFVNCFYDETANQVGRLK